MRKVAVYRRSCGESKRLFSLTALLSVAGLLSGCSGGSNPGGSNPVPLSVTIGSLPSATVQSSYSAVMTATGGTLSYRWSLSAGSLPGGLSLNASTGQISGTPGASGTFNFTASVTDSTLPTAQTATRALSITVAAGVTPVSIATRSLANGQQGAAYSATLVASGGTTPYSWNISAGALPAGLTLNVSTGAISGVPTASGSFTLTIVVTDSTTPTAQTNAASFTLNVVAHPVNRVLPDITGTAQVGQTLTASTGTWTNSPASYAYQWNNEGSTISGATNSTYVLQTSDLGALITIQVTATNSAGTSAPAISALVGPVVSTMVYYVSQSSGLDTNTGTDAADPWKTLAKVNAFAFSPGTSVLFNRGDRWDRSAGPGVFGTLRPTAAGTAGNPIVFDAYGTGANPIIDGSADASRTSAWTNIGTNLWQSTQTFPPKTSTRVTITIASPAVVTWGINGPINGSSVLFATTGSLPTGIAAGTIYQVVNASGGTFQITATPGGVAINTSGSQSGTQTAGANGLPYYNANDIGNIIWGFSRIGGSAPPAAMNASYGTMKGGGTGGVWFVPGSGTTGIAGTSKGTWQFNTDNFTVQVYSVGNPATVMPGLRLAMDADTLYIDKANLIFQNFTFQNMAASAITVKANTTIRDSVIQWVGGGNNGGQSNYGSRYGDGINPEASYTNVLIERNFIHQSYDVSISPQLGFSVHNNLTIRNNVFYRYGSAIGMDVTGLTAQDGLNIYNNTGFSNGAWSANQRPNRFPAMWGISLASAPGVTVTNTNVENNVLSGVAPFTLLVPTSGGESLSGMSATVFDYNDHATLDGTAPYIGVAPLGGNFTIASWRAGFGFETHGLIQVDPSFMNQYAGDLLPAPGSPLFGAGANLYSAGVVWDFNHKPRPASGPFTMGAFQ